MIPFNYRGINKTFINELSDKVINGQSVVLLGARNIGKRYVMKRLFSILEEAGKSPIIRIELLREPTLVTEKQVSNIIIQSVAEIYKKPLLDLIPSDNLFEAIDLLYSQEKQPIYLFAPNVDGMSHHIARRFLENVRARVESKELIVILSGEDDFRELVHGPKSEFNCANQFVIQGFDKDEFRSFVYKYFYDLKIGYDFNDDDCEYLWEQTGGNIYMLRLLLHTLIEFSICSTQKPAGFLDVAKYLSADNVIGIHESYPVRYINQIINRNPECWDDLESLIEDKVVKVGLLQGAPGPLELSGIAVRCGDQLRLASPLVQSFVKRYYNHRRLGDLYARDGQWDKALERYKRLKPEERIRPLGVDDRMDVELSIHSVIKILYSLAPKGIQGIRNIFAQGCQYILGFEEVTFWRFNKGWQFQQLDGQQIDDDIRNKVLEVLPCNDHLSPGWTPISNQWDRYAVAAILPSLRLDRRDAVVISNFGKEVVISYERERLAKEFISQLVDAYTNAMEKEQDKSHLNVCKYHDEIVKSIFNSLGSKVLDVGQVLAMAARGLKNLGYQRVLFCLVDPKGKKITGVYQDSDDNSVDVPKMTDYFISDPQSDLQPYVIYTKTSIIVEDPRNHYLANKEVVRQAKMKALAIVPIINPFGDAIGTIHIERSDGEPPSPEEVNDLESFGRQIAVAIEQSERVNLLQSALDKIPEPVVIIDRLERVRYANKPATDLLKTEYGWQECNKARKFAEFVEGPINEYIHESLEQGQRQRLVRHIDGIGINLKYKGAVLYDNISDWRGLEIGALIHIEGLNYLYRVFSAFQLIAEADDTNSAFESVLNASKLLGHKWGRLYLIDENDPNQLVSKLSFGFDDQNIANKFKDGKIELSHREEEDKESWLSIKKGTPIVFCYRPDLDDRTIFLTPQGLEVIGIRNPCCPESLKKEPGSFWLDFPLITKQNALGKITLQCDPDLMPEDFELLKVLSRMTAGALDAFIRREYEKRERWIRNSAEKAMSLTAHNIATRLASLPIILSRYRKREEKYSELKDLNDQYAQIVKETLETIKRTKERLSSVNPRFSEIDIISVLKRVMQMWLPNESWSIDSKESQLEIRIDEHLLESALIELIQNSREALPEHKSPFISLILEAFQRDSSQWVRIIYEDNGSGVKNELRERIFEDFFSIHPRRKSGIGLGLGFVRRVVEAHDGIIYENGKQNHGAIFVIEIPKFDITNDKKGGKPVVPLTDC